MQGKVKGNIYPNFECTDLARLMDADFCVGIALAREQGIDDAVIRKALRMSPAAMANYDRKPPAPMVPEVVRRANQGIMW